MGADESFEKFEEFKKEFERYKEYDLNESETRSKVIDNLLKGASGQAIENMNLMFGFDQNEGLKLKATTF